MDDSETPLFINIIAYTIATALIIGMIYVIYLGGIWVLNALQDFTPKSLATVSALLVIIPAGVALLSAMLGGGSAVTLPASLLIMALPISAAGLFISGVWFVISLFFN